MDLIDVTTEEIKAPSVARCIEERGGGQSRSGDDADTKVVLELLQEHKGQHCVRN